MVGKKNSGKGTYTKMFLEAIGVPATQLVVGDIVRTANLTRTTDKLLPTEKILDLVYKEAQKGVLPTIFLDGLPRNLEQIDQVVGIRKRLGLPKGHDLFALIDIPEVVMDERMKNRVVCPTCHTPRHPKLLLTRFLDRDLEKGEFFLRCDKDGCDKSRMIPKEGDNLGIMAIRDRLIEDQEVMEELFRRKEAKKILLSATLPLKSIDQVDDYEIHLIYDLIWDKKKRRVASKAKKWLFKDDLGRESYTLFPPAVTIHMIKEMVRILDI
jgi:adenylate kinase family enzyme